MLSPLHHATVVSLKELGCTLQRVDFLLLLLFLLAKDLSEHIALFLFLSTLGVLLLKLIKLMLLLLLVSDGLFTLLGFVAHLSVVRLKRLTVGLVSILVRYQKCFLSSLILGLLRRQLCPKVVNASLKLGHACLVSLLVLVFALLAFVRQVIDLSVLLRIELSLLVLELVNLEASILIGILTLLLKLFKVLLLGFQLLLQLFDALVRQLDLVCHPLRVLNRC